MGPESDPGRPHLARVGLLAFVCALVVFAVVMVLRGGGPGGDPVAPRPQDSPAAESAAVTEELERPADVDVRDPVEDGAVAEDAGEELAQTPVPVAAPEGERLVVRVLDPTGSPVEGVSVEWVAVHPSYGVSEQRIDGRTDAGGFVVPKEAERKLASRFGGAGVPGQGWMLSRLGLRCTLPFELYEPRDAADPSGVVWLEVEPAEGALVEVVLPPAGAVRFEWDPIVRAGEPLLEGYFLHIRRSDGKHFPRWRTGFTVPPGATQHRFAPVGTGWEVYGDLSHPLVLGSLGSVRAPGPMSVGETTVLRIERSEAQRDLVSLGGVVTDALAAPLAKARVHVSLGDPDVSGTPGRRVFTDERGAWSMLVARSTLLEFVGGAGGTGKGEVTLSAYLEGSNCRASALLEVGEAERDSFDLGPVAMVVPPAQGVDSILVAGGRVTDTTGKPLQGAYVRASVHATSVRSKPVEDPGAWKDLSWERTDRDGRYEIHEAVELAGKTVKVQVSQQDHLALEPVVVAAGRGDVDFVLTRGLAVSLTVDLEPWAAVAEVVSLRFTGEGRSHSPSLMDFLGHYKGSFSGLVPGRYHLKVRMRSGDWLLHEQDVEVSSDVDLGTLDLRGSLAICHVELFDVHGAPLAKQYVSVHDLVTGIEIDGSANVGEDGIARLVVPRDVVGVRISSHGGASAVVPSSAFSTPEPGVVPARISVTLRE